MLERRLKRAAFEDVAAMLWSIHAMTVRCLKDDPRSAQEAHLGGWAHC